MLGGDSAHRPPSLPGGFLVGPASRAPEGRGSLEQEEARAPPCLLWVPVSVTWPSAFQWQWRLPPSVGRSQARHRHNSLGTPP